MKAEYPPTNRLHYTTSNDIRNLAIRIGLPVFILERKPGNPNAEEGEDSQGGKTVEEDVISEAAQSEGSSSTNSDLEIDEVDLLGVTDQHEDEHDDQPLEHSFLGEQSDEVESTSPTSSVQASNLSDDMESRPSRTRRAPRRFVDD
ncbi:hypothetical protein COOONC_10720 [Cooperia oncophora]